jgi:hypothetical protein
MEKQTLEESIAHCDSFHALLIIESRLTRERAETERVLKLVSDRIDSLLALHMDE